jgi:hypothetical protein
MMPEEKQRLLELLDRQPHWCQHVEAQDAHGNAVHCDDARATAWDITGAMLWLFGETRAVQLYVQLDRHIHGKRHMPGWPWKDPGFAAMAGLQTFNDRADTTFDLVRSQLESIPVWSAAKRRHEKAREEPASIDACRFGENQDG